MPVTGGGTRQTVALVAAVLVAALLLAACGDSDSDSVATSTETSAPTEGSGPENPGGTPKNESKPQSEDQGSQSPGGGSENVSTPLEVSGGGSEQFRVKGGDNSIQEYGEESDESELEEIAENVHGFYVARAEEDWAKACSYLAQTMVSQLETLAEQSPELKGKGCAPVLKAFTRPLPASVRRETTVVDAGSFRRDDERGFFIYYDSEDNPYAIPLENEDGEWRLTLLSATPLG